MSTDDSERALRLRTADILNRAAEVQEAGDLWHLDDEFEVFEEAFFALPEPSDDLETVKEFMNGWTDARNHDWKYYEPIEALQWPRLAREIAASLVAGQPIANRTIQERFGAAARRASSAGCLGALLGVFPRGA